VPGRSPIQATLEQLAREEIPNLLRLYANPFVAQTCFSLSHYIKTTWSDEKTTRQDYQSFLANSFDEALSGAIKLARYAANSQGLSTSTVILDPLDRLGPFASAPIMGGQRVEFLPGITVVGRHRSETRRLCSSDKAVGILVLLADEQSAIETFADEVRKLNWRFRPLVITCVDRNSLGMLRRRPGGILREIAPDIVVFDDSFVGHAAPFGAFSAGKALYAFWNQPGKTTFHSTTYQPNSISTLHFMKCLEHDDPALYSCIAEKLEQIKTNLSYRMEVFGRLYSPSLVRMIRASGFLHEQVRASGDFIQVGEKRIFDAVAGVACSIRGHNNPNYLSEIDAPETLRDCQDELRARLQGLTGLAHYVPAVSGASAVENALKMALVAQHPRRHIVALKSGFGGKTLLALTGTARNSYKEKIEPLYAEVTYVDPFAADAIAQLERVLTTNAVAVVQLELIQAVGGVRPVPEKVIRFVDEQKERSGYLLLVDEVQTGFYRTGPFSLARAMGLSPDFLLLGKGTSDMMFPGALTLYSDRARSRLDDATSTLADTFRQRYGYEFGCRTILNVLRFAEKTSLADRVSEAGKYFANCLTEQLAGCRAVRQVRVHGMLIAIELNVSRWPQRLVAKRLLWCYLYGMLHHPTFPVLVGFCQYEPNVLKITPSLTVAREEIHKVSITIADVLKLPLHRLIYKVVRGLMKPIRRKKEIHEQHRDAAPDFAQR
jgi:acetylornithine/succinyldiaminopimelate/putrescine aminotransferase